MFVSALLAILFFLAHFIVILMKLLHIFHSVAAEIERKRNFFARFLALLVPGIPEQLARMVALNTKVEGFAQLDYKVTNVFVTFETEKDQVNIYFFRYNNLYTNTISKLNILYHSAMFSLRCLWGQ